MAPADITLTTDGSGTTRGNPGGWACVLRCGDYVRELSGGAGDTTNNLMELEAVAQGLSAIKAHGAAVTIRTDSQLVIGWLTRAYRIRLPHIESAAVRIWTMAESKQLRLTFIHVRGHTGDPDNERCDQLAGAARRQRLIAC